MKLYAIKCLSCSAQQRTAANATKKRVMPNQVAHPFKQMQCPANIKLSFHRSIGAAALSCCLFNFFSCRCLSLSLLSVIVGLCWFTLTYTHLCPSCLSSVSPFPLSPLLFLLFTAKGEILVSILPVRTFTCHFLFGWPFRPCREMSFVLLDEEEGSETVIFMDVS